MLSVTEILMLLTRKLKVRLVFPNNICHTIHTKPVVSFGKDGI